MTPRQRLLGAALALAAGLAIFADKSPATSVAEAVVRTGAPAAPLRAATARAGAVVAEPAILGLRERAAPGEFGAGAAVFLSQDWTPPPPKPAPAPPPPPPSAPPLPFTFIGKAGADGSWAVFLSRADQTYVVRAHSVIDGGYRVEQIAPPLMTITYLPLNQVQQLNIGVPD